MAQRVSLGYEKWSTKLCKISSASRLRKFQKTVTDAAENSFLFYLFNTIVEM